jgi:hypothetical protein
VALEEAVVERAVDQVERDLNVEVSPDLTARDGPLEDLPGLSAARLDNVPLVLSGEGRVGPRLGDQGPDHPGVRPGADEFGPWP